MHIPSCGTEDIDILSFDEALSAPPSGGYDSARWIYVPDYYCDYRYILGTRGEKPLICIGVNPSTAEPGNLDNTLKSVERIALGNGFDSFIMFNVYAQRATRPDDMDRELNERLHRENMRAFEYVLRLSAARPAVWAAWGAVIEKRAYLPLCVRDMAETGERCGAEWFCCDKRSKAGHPHHPLYLAKNSPLEPFDVREYLEGALSRC